MLPPTFDAAQNIHPHFLHCSIFMRPAWLSKALCCVSSPSDVPNTALRIGGLGFVSDSVDRMIRHVALLYDRPSKQIHLCPRATWSLWFQWANSKLRGGSTSPRCVGLAQSKRHRIRGDPLICGARVRAGGAAGGVFVSNDCDRRVERKHSLKITHSHLNLNRES